MSLRRVVLPLLALVLGAGAFIGMQSSGATFTHASTYATAVTAANDWTPPTVAMTAPPALVSGAVTVSATASDSRGTVASVAIQYAPSGGSTWTTLCTSPTSPYSCAWTTTAVTDGTYQLRAIATDDSGNAATSATVTTQVVNTAAVALTVPSDTLRGTVSLVGTTTGLPGGAYLSFYYGDASTSSWTAITGCGVPTTMTTARTCSFATAGVTSGSYDLRVLATSSTGTAYNDYAYDITVDNNAPTTILGVPAGTLSGTVNLTASATDDDSGVDTVLFEYRFGTTGAWVACGSDTMAPYACALDTTALTMGTYYFRATATDFAGNVAVTGLINRMVSNLADSVSITGPADGTFHTGTSATLSATAASVMGVTNVAIQVKTGSGAYATVCTDTSSPYSCAWNISAISKATYSVQAVLTNAMGAKTTSAAISVTVDNSPLRAKDVQAVDVQLVGKPAVGDQLVLTYSAVVDTTTILAGWNGSATTVPVTFYDKSAKGSLVTGYDNVGFGSTNLGSVAFTQNYLGNKRTASFPTASMAATTQTVGGVPVTVVTVTLGSTASTLRTVTSTGTMMWTPSTLVKTAAGLACSSTSATESGNTDRDF